MSDIIITIEFSSDNTEIDIELVKEKINKACTDLEHLPHYSISYKLTDILGNIIK